MKNALNKFISSLDFLFGLVGIVMILIAVCGVCEKYSDCFYAME